MHLYKSEALVLKEGNLEKIFDRFRNNRYKIKEIDENSYEISNVIFRFMFMKIKFKIDNEKILLQGSKRYVHKIKNLLGDN